jgi:hypothetical protein
MKQDTILRSAAFSVVACTVLVATSALPVLAAPSLTMPVNYPVGQQPWSVVVALLDGDSYLDLAVANRGG